MSAYHSQQQDSEPQVHGTESLDSLSEAVAGLVEKQCVHDAVKLSHRDPVKEHSIALMIYIKVQTSSSTVQL